MHHTIPVGDLATPHHFPDRPRLAPELQPREPTPITEDAPLSEAEIRKLQAERHGHLFNKD